MNDSIIASAHSIGVAEPKFGLRVGGFTPITTIDYPDHLACVVYTQGCPLRCKYCHNPDLIPFGKGNSVYQWSDIQAYLDKREGIIEAVVFSGGEPTLQAGLGAVMQAVSAQGYKVGLHTAGVSASALALLLDTVDWVGLDVKGTQTNYGEVSGRHRQWESNQKCIDLMLSSVVDFECRTTVDWRLISSEDLLYLAEKLASKGVTHYAVQINHGSRCLDSALHAPAFLPEPEIDRLKQELSNLFVQFQWRE